MFAHCSLEIGDTNRERRCVTREHSRRRSRRRRTRCHGEVDGWRDEHGDETGESGESRKVERERLTERYITRNTTPKHARLTAHVPGTKHNHRCECYALWTSSLRQAAAARRRRPATARSCPGRSRTEGGDSPSRAEQRRAAQRTRAARLPMSASSLSKSMPTGEGQKRWWKRPEALSDKIVTACRVQKEAAWRRATYWK